MKKQRRRPRVRTPSRASNLWVGARPISSPKRPGTLGNVLRLASISAASRVASSIRVSTIPILGHGLDDLTFTKIWPPLPEAAQVGLTSLTRTVHHATHHGNTQRNLHVAPGLGHVLGQLPPFTCARPQEGQDTMSSLRGEGSATPESSAHLPSLHRRGGEGHANRVADALGQQNTERPTELLMVPWNAGPASVTPGAAASRRAQPAGGTPPPSRRGRCASRKS